MTILAQGGHGESSGETTGSSSGYEPREFWNRRLAGESEARAVGSVGLSERLNLALYEYCMVRLGAVTAALGLDLKGSEVLDVGSGRGFYVKHLLRSGARVSGSDISDVAVARLRKEFPDSTFFQGDISEGSTLPDGARFDLITAFSVFVHIVSDERWTRALRNLSARLRPGGYLLVDDLFPGKSTGGDSYCRNRSARDWELAVSHAGLQVVRFFPGPLLVNRNKFFQLAGEAFPGFFLTIEKSVLRIEASRPMTALPPPGKFLGPRGALMVLKKPAVVLGRGVAE